MHKKPPYNCPCCKYCTARKDAMQRHFNLKKPCCLLFADSVPLTPEIKAHVLANRVWYPPKESLQVVKQYNQFNSNVSIIVEDFEN